MRQLLAESKAETSDLRRQIEELVTENNRIRGNKTGMSNGHSSTDSVSHVHGKLSEVCHLHNDLATFFVRQYMQLMSNVLLVTPIITKTNAEDLG